MPDSDTSQDTQWLEGPELNLHAGMTSQEIRAVALTAAAQLLAITGQPRGPLLPSVIQTANALCDYIQKGSVRGL